MIFKTINSSVDKTRKTLALFNKDWNTYKTNWNKGFSQNGFTGGVKSIFQSNSQNSVISQDQVQILRNWNNAVTHGCTSQETFNRIIANADDNTKMYFAGLNKGKGSIEGLKNAQNVAKQSTIGLTIAQTALNIAISMGLTAAIKGFDKLINSAKRTSEAADEAFSATNEKVQQNEEEAKSLDELISKYKELKESSNLDIDSRKEVKELQNDIADLVGTQAKNLDLVNGKLDEEIKKLNKISAKEAKRAYETATANYNNSRKASAKATGDDSFLFVDGYAYVGKREEEAEKILKDAGFGNNVQSGGFFGNTLFITDTFDNDFKELKGAQEKADYLQSMIDVLEENEQTDTELWTGLVKQRDHYLEYINNQQGATNSLVNSWITYSQFSNEELSKINVDSVESFETYRQKMIEEAKNDESIGKMLADGTLSNEDLEKAINNFMATSLIFSKWYEQWLVEQNQLQLKEDLLEKLIPSRKNNSAGIASVFDNYFSDTDVDTVTGRVESLTEEELKLANSKEFEHALSEQKKKLGGAKLSINDYASALQEVQDSTLNKNPISFTDVISQVQSLSKGLDQLNKIYVGISDKEDIDWSSILNNDEFKNTFGSFEKEYDDFIKTVFSSPDDIGACQSAFDNLATAYINNSDALKHLSADTEDATVKMLKQMGISNAQELVTARLAAQEAFLAEKKRNSAIESENLAGATWQELSYILSEGNASQTASSYLAQFALAKLNITKSSINTDSDINAIVAIANAATNSKEHVNALSNALANLQYAKEIRLRASLEAINNTEKATMLFGQSAFMEIGAQMQADSALDRLKNNIDDSKLNPADFYAQIKGDTETDNKSGSSSESESAAKETKETFDWIETAIKRISTALDHLKERADNTYSSWTSRNENLRNAIASTQQSIDLQAQAYQRYMAQAESVPLPAAWKNVVQNGAIDISMISDENLTENIREYQTWYDKAQDCLNTQQELNKSLNELESHRFTNLQSEYESLTELMETQKSLLEGQITVLSNGADYDRLRSEQNHILTNLRNERSVLEATLNSLSIERGTEEWNNLQSAVTKTSQSIQDAEKSLREINRMQFDNLKEFFESSISLMEKQKDNAQNRITLLSGSGDYESLKRQQQNIIAKYESELNALNGLKNSNVFSGMSYEDRMGVLSDIEDVTGSLDDARNALMEISQLEFDNIKELYDFEKSTLEHRIKLDEEKIRLAESMGLFASVRTHTDQKHPTERQLSAA